MVYAADWVEYNKYSKEVIGDIGGGLLANEIALSFLDAAANRSKAKVWSSIKNVFVPSCKIKGSCPTWTAGSSKEYTNKCFFSIHNGGLTIEALLQAWGIEIQVEQLQFKIRGDAKPKASYFYGWGTKN